MKKDGRLDFDNVFIFSHSQEGTTGTDDELFDFVKDKVTVTRMFKFPFMYSSDGAIRGRFADSGGDSFFKSKIKFYKPQVLSYVKDVLYACHYCRKYIKNNSLIVCTDNILVVAISIPVFFARLFKKKIKIVYQVIDYTPRRFKNSLLNSVYEWIDKKAFEKTDFVWVLNKKMIDGRVEDKGYPLRENNILVVPFGNNSNKYKDSDFKKFNLNNIAYLGGVFKSKGSELFTGIVKELVGRGHKNIVLHVVGGGDIEDLKKEIKEKGLEKNIKIYSSMAKQEDVEKILLKCSLAIAPYNPNDKNSFSFYADPGKVKVYLGCGLPIVITKVPEIYKTIVKEKAGVTANYGAKDFADKITDILGNIEEYRGNARKLGLGYSWDSIFTNAFGSMKKKINEKI